ncbi:MAG: beta-N-acetylhexosaminidase [Magnetococcales bacterium]|nr:beta-N-acetylhexosaminidase [Magnetococcales bacterium]
MKESKYPAGHLVIGIAGKTLESDEQAWIMDHKPAGVILFSRNLGTLDEVVALVRCIRATTDPPPTLWLDQEGGRVQRLRTPLTRYPTAEALARWDQRDTDDAVAVAYLWGLICGQELTSLGFGVNCAPVLDLREPGAHPVIGDRAFGDHPEQVIRLARGWLQGLAQSGCMAVGKHFPGHGAAMVDSHRHLPVVDKSRQRLDGEELLPFRTLAGELPALMTAHLVATEIDRDHPATWSSRILIDLLRREWGYRGLVVSDAIEMAALEGDIRERTRRAVVAGCDLVLVCTGRMEDNEAAQRGVIAAWEEITHHGGGPLFRTETIGRMLDKYRVTPGDWRQLLADESYRHRRARLEAVATDILGVDPTEPVLSVDTILT